MSEYKDLLQKAYEQKPIQSSSPTHKNRPRNKKFKHDTPAKHIKKSQLISYYLGIFMIIVFVLYWLSELFIGKDFSLLRFLGAVNIASFVLFGSDKMLASSHHQITRVPEMFFYIISIIGGSLGIILGAQAFHHKTLKMRFMIWPVLIFLIQLVLIAYFWPWMVLTY